MKQLLLECDRTKVQWFHRNIPQSQCYTCHSATFTAYV